MKNSDGCARCQDIVQLNEELEQDVRSLQSMILDVNEFYEELFERHCDDPGILLLNSHLGRAVGNPEELLKVLPEGKENPRS